MSHSNQHDRMICTCVRPPSGFPLLCILHIRYVKAKYCQWLVLNGCKHPDSGVDYVYSLQLAREMVSFPTYLLLKGSWCNAIASECCSITALQVNFCSFFQESLTTSFYLGVIGLFIARFAGRIMNFDYPYSNKLYALLRSYLPCRNHSLAITHNLILLLSENSDRFTFVFTLHIVVRSSGWRSSTLNITFWYNSTISFLFSLKLQNSFLYLVKHIPSFATVCHHPVVP